MYRSKYLWITDTHTKIIGRYKLLNTILDQKPTGVFLTGDISEGFAFLSDLEFLGKKIGRPLYFITGNHEYWGSSFEKVNSGIQKLSHQYKNLIWMDEAGIITLNDDTCLIGHGNWYDARVGNPDLIKFTFDWWAIKDFRDLPSMKHRIEAMRDKADRATQILCSRLEEALDNYKTVYMMVHVPPFIEAHRPDDWLSDSFYEPYNTNIFLGQQLEKVMARHKKRHLTILSGHCHTSMTVLVSRNIECRVGKGAYHKVSEEEVLYI